MEGDVLVSTADPIRTVGDRGRGGGPGPDPRTPRRGGPGPSVASRIRNRRWPVVLTLVTLVTGMAFMLFWNPVVYHHQQWAMGGDVWGIWRAAHYVGWGDLGGVYTPGTGVVSLPGMPMLLAPLAMLSGRLGLTETSLPLILSHPTAALILEPAEILTSCTALFAADAVAERLGVGGRRRVALCVAVAVLAWPVGVLWGHAEDTLALAVALYALLAALDGRWARCGWLFGVAVAFQPLVALLLPVLVASSPVGQRVRTFVRTLALPGVLLLLAYVGNAADTWRAVVQQPTPPSVNHATPWAALAPVVERVTVHAQRYSQAVLGHSGGFTTTVSVVRPTTLVAVSGGPGRFVYFALAVVAGLYVWRRPQPPVRLLWIAALVLGARCCFEAVMTPYYLAPPFVLGLVVASRSGARRFWPATVVALATSVFAYLRFAPWVWWLPVVAGAAAVVALAHPSASVVADSAGVGRIEGEVGAEVTVPVATAEPTAGPDGELVPA